MSSSRSAVLPIRQSCDRCHGQKLRCVRQSSGETSACVRCLRLGQDMWCVYSATLPKGRPSAHQRNQMSSQRLSAKDSRNPQIAFAQPQAPLESFMEDNDMWMWDEEGFRSVDTSSSASTSADETGGNIYMQMPMQFPTADEDDIIAQLSALSVLLYPLYRTSCTLTPHQDQGVGVSANHYTNSINDSIISDAILASATVWLANTPHFNSSIIRSTPLEERVLIAPSASNTPDSTAFSSSSTILHDMLSTSRQLLEILHHRVDFSSQNAQCLPVSSSYSQPDSLTATTSTIPTSTASDTVVCHLVLACHTLLLNIYSAFLLALQHDAELRRDSDGFRNNLPQTPFSSAACSSSRDPTHTSDLILADMRMASVVQLCSYFIHRLRQAVLAYFSSRPSSPYDDGSNLGVISELEKQLQQHLLKLKRTLHI